MHDLHDYGRVLTLKLKLHTFEVRTRQQPLVDLTDQAEVIAACAVDLLREEIRLAIEPKSSVPPDIITRSAKASAKVIQLEK
ncbi:unnamed protein product [Protopolystoma xenopodis]|uniref:DNA polymerase Y-family little finger domain-containing protein n=1 Tax=Protopolystoma xenopodis TaxID=117903 RepID=A0A3S5BMP1_9PLAT|nr:unnamed protein product [Protopolystoma xenopodis]